MTSDFLLSIRKLDRLASGAAPRLIELCSGCGGLTLGLKTAGFQLAAHVEADAQASETYALNFGPDDPNVLRQWSRARNMVSQSMADLVSDFGLNAEPREAYDVLAAGLPCQAFARIGRSKLRSVSGDSDAYKNDPRASLYQRFLEIVAETRPLAILLENVPDIMNFGGHNVPEEIADGLEAQGYSVRYTLLNAAYYGVPQLRERLILVALDRTLCTNPVFPLPTHFVQLPRGYENTRAVAMQHVNLRGSHFEPIPVAIGVLPYAIDVESALADLPLIDEHLTDSGNLRKRKAQDRLPYRSEFTCSEYAKLMREWIGFSTTADVSGNIIRITPRDFPIFGQMPNGADYPIALTIARRLLEEKIRRSAAPPSYATPAYTAVEKATVPPYDDGKFPNKWWKLDRKLLSRTLTAHLGKDTYTHIHYDGGQQRMISVREAARLQSFPDGFEFSGAMNPSFRQVGNAVPPLLALAVGKALMGTLRQAVSNSALGRISEAMPYESAQHDAAINVRDAGFHESRLATLSGY